MMFTTTNSRTLSILSSTTRKPYTILNERHNVLGAVVLYLPSLHHDQMTIGFECTNTTT